MKNKLVDSIETGYDVEARSGFEPLNKGFADLSTLSVSSNPCNVEPNNVPVNVPATCGALEIVKRFANREGYVYLIEADGVGRVKIGMSESNPSERFRVLDTASPVDLHMVAILPGGASLEARLHAHFAAARVKGEWFQVTPEMRAFLTEAETIWREQVKKTLEVMDRRFLGEPEPPITPSAVPEPVSRRQWMTLAKAQAFFGGSQPSSLFRKWMDDGWVSIEEICAAMVKGRNHRPDMMWEVISRQV